MPAASTRALRLAASSALLCTLLLPPVTHVNAQGGGSGSGSAGGVNETPQQEDVAIRTELFVFILATIVLISAMCCVVHFTCGPQLRAMLAKRRAEAVHEMVVDFRKAHPESVDMAAMPAGATLELSVFNGEQSVLPYDRAKRADTYVVKYDDASRTFTATLNVPPLDRWPTTVQTNYPLSSKLGEKWREVYYEVQVESLSESATLSIGWATFLYPPFRLPGEEPHSVALVSPGRRKGNTPHLFFVHCDKSFHTVEEQMNAPLLRDGDVVGAGYLVVERHGALVIDFWFTVNGKKVNARGISSFRAINKLVDPGGTKKALEAPGEASNGILANGCAHPTVGASTGCRLKFRFSPPWTHDPPHQLSEEQQHTVRRRSIGNVDALSMRVMDEAGELKKAPTPAMTEDMLDKHNRSMGSDGFASGRRRSRSGSFTGGGGGGSGAVIGERRASHAALEAAAAAAAAHAAGGSARRASFTREASGRRGSRSSAKVIPVQHSDGGGGSGSGGDDSHSNHHHHKKRRGSHTTGADDVSHSRAGVKQRSRRWSLADEEAMKAFGGSSGKHAVGGVAADALGSRGTKELVHAGSTRVAADRTRRASMVEDARKAFAAGESRSERPRRASEAHAARAPSRRRVSITL